MKSQTIGQVLSDARKAHRYSLEKLSAETHIKPEMLQALEANQFQQLPSAAYVKGYIQAYSRVFDLDYRSLLALLRRDYKESAKGTLVPREFIKTVRKRQVRWTPVTWIALVVVLFASMIISYASLQWYRTTRPPQLIVVQPESRAVVAASVQVGGYTDPTAVVQINDELVAVRPDGSFESMVDFPVEGLGIITIEASDREGRVAREQRIVYVQF